MKRIVVICQKVDEKDDLLGFFVAWLRQFARHFDRVDVIALGVWTHDLPGNVRVFSLGKERGSNAFYRLLRLKWLLFRLMPGASAVFCHMSPIFAIATWPFTYLFRSKLVLWYLHRSVTLRLRLALALCDRVVTADADSLRVKNPKIVAVGHGIDTGRFAVPGRQYDASRPLRIIGVGRLAPIKDFGTLIRALALLKERETLCEVRIVGRAINPEHHAEEACLRTLVTNLKLDKLVTFVGYVPYPEMPSQYAWADVAVGCTPPGGLDKALLESMAAGCIAVTSNKVMRGTLGAHADALLFRHGEPADLAGKIQNLNISALSPAMVRAVREHHDLERTIGRISELLL